MIADTFKRGSAYSLGSAWQVIFPEIVRMLQDVSRLPEGRLEIPDAPNGVYANVEAYAPKTEENARFESHDRMADIQIVLEGDEFIDVFPLDGSEKAVFSDDARDLAFYEGKDVSVRVHLMPGTFALILPGEAHKPCIRAKSDQVLKMVVKIPAVLLGAPSLI